MTDDGLSYTRSFIVLKNQYVLVRFTRFHNYTGAYNGRTVRSLTLDANARMHYICMMLNYILIENDKIYRIDHQGHKGNVGSVLHGLCSWFQSGWRVDALEEKACSSVLYANLWGFVAMRFVCGLRSTDIVRLPKPDLAESQESFRKTAVEGTPEAPEAISQDIRIRLRCRTKRPHKTMAGSGIPDVKVLIPALMEKPMGSILGIAESHCDDIRTGGAFLYPDRSISGTRSFLLEGFHGFPWREGVCKPPGEQSIPAGA